MKTGKGNLVSVLNSLVHVYPEHFKSLVMVSQKEPQ